MLLRTFEEVDGDQKQTGEICMQTNRKCYIKVTDFFIELECDLNWSFVQ